MLFKKRPVQVEAFKWTADHDQTEDPEWIVAAIKDGRVWFGRDSLNNVTMIISTLEGNMTATPGDWIIKGVADEIYPCKPEIFERTYRASTPVNFERPAGDIVVALRQEDATNNQSLLDEASRVIERMRDALHQIDAGEGYPGMRSLLTVLNKEMMQQIAHEALESCFPTVSNHRPSG